MQYYYRDNWNGGVHEFATLREAKAAARRECGSVIRIRKMGSEVVHIVEASGYTYP